MITIHGTGCSLMDYLYTDIDLSSPPLRRAMSKTPGDGGLSPGKLVFVEDLERFLNESFHDFLNEATGGKKPDKANVGGPSIVSLINAAQLLEGAQNGGFKVAFFGGHGHDETADELLEILAQTPLDVSEYREVEGVTPFTVVLSDPNADNGHGERTFINSMGAVLHYGPADLPDSFFDANIVAFGGTALVPDIHDHLASLTRRSREAGSIVVVNTVYDYRNQAKNATGRWPLGEDDTSYMATDLLITDKEEAFRLSGEISIPNALAYFASKGTEAAVVTDGSRDIYFYSKGNLFSKLEIQNLPVSESVRQDILNTQVPKGDTTGCGDNFVGGILASMAEQLEVGVPIGKLDLIEACSWAVASGGFSCFYVGGTYLERTPGEKRERIAHYYDLYEQQIGRNFRRNFGRNQ
ncbi:MAG TPA: carbohydrate kinase family protein [Spirochaetales bacterium]|nr:carbohydrate kinase family protein [Spirochaetales bacterium]